MLMSRVMLYANYEYDICMVVRADSFTKSNILHGLE